MVAIPGELLVNAQKIARRAAVSAPQCEAARTLTPELVATLREIGIFRMFVPRSHGGLELDLPQSLAVFETLAAGDGAVGWTAMIGSHLPLVGAALPRTSFDSIYAQGPDVIGAGSVVPAGRAEIVEGGYRVSGRWPFATGCCHADWLYGFCIATKGGVPVSGPAEGVPSVKVVFAPRSEWRIEDTWHASGLKGSGSHHVALNDVRVPEEMSFEILTAPSELEGPLYAAGPIALLSLHLGSIAIGVSEGAIRDLATGAISGRRQLRSRYDQKDDPIFQYELGRADADVRAARALLRSECDALWQSALDGRSIDFGAMARAFQAVAWVTATCARATDMCFTLGGGSALYETSPLQRRLRDIHAVTQHVLAHHKRFGSAGRLRLGFPAVHPLMDG